MTDPNLEIFAARTCPICSSVQEKGVVCVKCGARFNKKIPLRHVNYLSFFMVALGVILVFTAYSMKQPGLAEIGELTDEDDGSYIKVHGKISKFTYDKRRNDLKLTVSDNTGKINIKAGNKLDKFKTYFNGKLPGYGDVVEITGAVNISDTYGTSMFLSIPERMKIVKRLKIVKKKLYDIDFDDKGKIVIINVVAVNYEIYNTRSGYKLHKIMLRDSSGEREMTLFSSTFENLPRKIQRALQINGSHFVMYVLVDSYRDEISIKLCEPAMLKTKSYKKIIKYLGRKKVSKNVDTKVPYGVKKVKIIDINYDMIGKKVLVTGRVAGISYFDRGKAKGSAKIIINDGTEQIEMFVYKTYVSKIKDFKNRIRQNSEITAVCKVGEFRGDMQLSLETERGFSIK